MSVTSSVCHSAKILSTKVGYSLIAMVTYLHVVISLIIRGGHGIQCTYLHVHVCYLTYDSRGSMACSSLIISEMLPEIHIMEKCDFLKSIIHSQIIYFSV